MAWTEIEHGNPEDLAAACAARIETALDQALAARGRAVLALAGGRTSPPVFRRMAQTAREWTRVSILPTDERWVAHAHADCNLRQMREAFVGAEGIDWRALTPSEPAGAADATFANAQLAAVNEPFDAVLLGMGLDGHFGSLFPGSPNLVSALDPDSTIAAAAIQPDPMPSAGPFPRISLTLSRMLRSRLVLLAITGLDKRAVLGRAQLDPDAMRLPVAALLHAPGASVEVHWSP